MKTKLFFFFSFMMMFAFSTMVLTPTNSYAMSIYDDDDEEDSEDVQELLTKARQLSNNENFTQAYSLIKKAKKLGIDKDDIKNTKSFVSKKEQKYHARIKVEQERKERERLARIAQEEARQAQNRYNQSGDKGGSLRCSRVASNYALYRYCKTGSCDALASNYEVYRLCKDDEYSSLPYGVYNYLKNGEPYGLSGYKAQTGAKQNSGSFSDRKRFIIYYLNGYIYKSY